MAREFKDAASCWKEILSDISKNRGMLSVIETFAREDTAPAKIVFGTSGWRGEIGTDFTFNNIRVVTSAIIRMFKDEDSSVMKAIGVKNFKEIKERGVIVGHDNRFLGYDFAMEVIGLLQKEGIKTWYAGEAPTPEFSTGIEMLHAACSINLTPSHNPANYAGFKFNPSDGGPAGPEITTKIEEISNKMMEKNTVIEPSAPARIEKKDLTELYIKFITNRKTLDIDKIRNFVNTEDCIICVDYVHGSTRGRIERILGSSDKIVHLRTGDDYLFGGIAPEPSEKNMQLIDNCLKETGAKFKLGAIMDPDGDRIRHADGSMQIPMNYFGAMAFHFLHTHKKISGIVTKSVGTSNFVNAIAERLKVPVKETKVGFKHFRPYLSKNFTPAGGKAIVAFEESDGISAYNHTLEKDAIFGLLLAIEMIAVTGKNLNEYLRDLMNEFGHYYPDRSGISVDPELVGAPLKESLSRIKENFPVGTEVIIGKEKRTVKNVIDVDGVKIVFDDSSWLMIRPSGTEPKVRFYIESRSEEGKEFIFGLAEKITRDAISTAKM